MGILAQADRNRWAAEGEPTEQSDGTWITSEGWTLPGMSTAGVHVNASAVYRIAAAQACIRVLAETLAYLPLQMFEWINEDDRQLARRHQLYEKLHYQPNDWQTSFEWREMMMGHVLLRPGAYSRILPGPTGAVDQLIPLHPDRMTVEQLSNYRLVYHYITKAGKRETYNQEEIFHLRGLSDDGIIGMAQMNLGRDVFGTAIATEEYGANMFRHGAQLGGLLRKKTPGAMKPEYRANLEAGLRKFTGSKNAFKTMLLEEDLEWTQVGMRAKDAEFLLSRKFSVREICRIFRVPPHMIQDLEQATFSNIEHQSLEFVVYTLGPWLVRWEQAIRRDLILPYEREKYFAEFNVDGLLRGDIVSRYTAYGIGIEKGFKTRNEVRRSENMNPIDGLDTPLRPLNMGNGAEPPAEEGSGARTAMFVRSNATRLANREAAALRKALQKFGEAEAGQDRSEWHAWLNQFYADYALELSKGLMIPYLVAQEFAVAAKQDFLDWPGIEYRRLSHVESTRTKALTELGLMKGDLVNAG